jgi:glycogen debranching enzyme
MTPSGQHCGWGNTQETAQFIHCLRDCVRWTGDLSVAKELYGYCKKALFEFLLKERCQDGDVLPQGPGVAEVANLDAKVVDTACHTCTAAEALAEMADWFQEPDVAARAGEVHERLRTAIPKRFWIEELGEFGDNIGTAERWAEVLPGMIRAEKMKEPGSDTRPLEDLLGKVKGLPPDQEVTGHYGTVWGSSVLVHGLASEEQAVQQLTAGESEKYTGRFGIYNKWRCKTHSMTIITGEFINAELRYGRPDAVVPYLLKIAHAFSLEMPGAATEMSPNYGCFMQAWTAYALHHAVVYHMIGIQPNAPKKSIRIAPQIPEAWKPRFGALNIHVGDIALDVVHVFEDGLWTTEVETKSKGWTLDYHAPRGQAEARLKVNGETHKGPSSLRVNL